MVGGSPRAQGAGLQFLGLDPLACSDVPPGPIDLGQGLGVGEEVERVLEGLEIFVAYQDRSRPAVPGEDDPLMVLFDLVSQFLAMR